MPQRKDFSLKPPAPTVLDFAQEAGVDVWGVGKVDDLFANQGITSCVHVKDNDEGISQIITSMKSVGHGIILANLGDFDTLYGHRNNPRGFANALETFDHRLPEILDSAQPNDVLFITADHGCDPTTPGTDHSREYVPLLVWGPNLRKGVNLGTRSTFADLGATLASLLGIRQPQVGKSFVQEITN